MDIHFCLSEGEYIYFSNDVVKHSRWVILLKVVWLSIPLFALMEYGITEWKKVMMIALCTVLTHILFFEILMKKLFQYEARKFSGEYILTLYNGLMEIIFFEQTITLPCEELRLVYIGKNYFYFTFGHYQPLIIPFATFLDDNQKNMFTEYLHSRIRCL